MSIGTSWITIMSWCYSNITNSQINCILQCWKISQLINVNLCNICCQFQCWILWNNFLHNHLREFSVDDWPRIQSSFIITKYQIISWNVKWWRIGKRWRGWTSWHTEEESSFDYIDPLGFGNDFGSCCVYNSLEILCNLIGTALST